MERIYSSKTRKFYISFSSRFRGWGAWKAWNNYHYKTNLGDLSRHLGLLRKLVSYAKKFYSHSCSVGRTAWAWWMCRLSSGEKTLIPKLDQALGSVFLFDLWSDNLRNPNTALLLPLPFPIPTRDSWWSKTDAKFFCVFCGKK